MEVVETVVLWVPVGVDVTTVEVVVMETALLVCETDVVEVLVLVLVLLTLAELPGAAEDVVGAAEEEEAAEVAVAATVVLVTAAEDAVLVVAEEVEAPKRQVLQSSVVQEASGMVSKPRMSAPTSL